MSRYEPVQVFKRSGVFYHVIPGYCAEEWEDDSLKGGIRGMKTGPCKRYSKKGVVKRILSSCKIP